MQTRRVLVALLVSCCLESSFAQTPEDTIKKQALLSVSAFQCAVLAPTPAQQERLFALGLKAGREFVETAKSKPELYAKVRMEIPMLWTTTGGPTTDFIVGQVYAHLENTIYQKFDPDKDRWKMIKDGMYREKNCELIR